MKHLDEGALQALADGEQPPEGAEAHLAVCAPCAADLARLRGTRALLSGALARADVTPPTARAQMAVRRRRAGRWTGEARQALLRAAALLLLVGGGVAVAAVPGSPLRAWLADDAPAAPAEQSPAAAAVREAPAPPPVAGVSILPDEGGVRVVINGAAPGLRVHTRVGDGDLVEVSALGPAATARFRTSPGRVEVVGAGAGEVRITLPRGAAAAAVEVDGRVYLAREGGRLRGMVPEARPGNDGEAEFSVRR